jgi:hypothetical protein
MISVFLFYVSFVLLGIGLLWSGFGAVQSSLALYRSTNRFWDSFGLPLYFLLVIVVVAGAITLKEYGL